ncbi:hypothetical protein Q4488_13950 [Amphritea sp. 1_MG-2023]|uniref:hypothetical protein n=1 Tax=Amphritea sp. 1_MG-2023 TaxID=3062670 RepID=UPI0026E40467|nr:hypothetical protein [Amphritea sp. 1_MG-2023]MDO6564489.1 hypothetical protein [Amphritea sp. 1_MG-2023]
MDDVAKGQNLDDFLINLAEGLSKAQSRLNQYPVVNAMGQQSMVYHIPRMEFELKLQMTAAESSVPASSGRGTSIQKKAKLQFLPVKTTQQNNSSSATSIIKGVMVAAPIDSVVTPVQLSLSVTKIGARKAEVTVSALTTEASIKGALVELNIDRELSEKMSKAALKPATRLNQATLVLAENGSAVAGLTISNQESEGQVIALTADLLGQSQTLLYRFEQG